MEKTTTGAARAKLILKGLGYTPKTLSKVINTTECKAQRILKDGGKINYNELIKVFYIITTITFDDLFYGVAERGIN